MSEKHGGRALGTNDKIDDLPHRKINQLGSKGYIDVLEHDFDFLDQPSSEPSSTSGGGGGRDEDSGGRETRRGVREDSGNDSGHNSMMTSKTANKRAQINVSILTPK